MGYRPLHGRVIKDRLLMNSCVGAFMGVDELRCLAAEFCIIASSQGVVVWCSGIVLRNHRNVTTTPSTTTASPHALPPQPP
jgi:hypothetical protein